MGYTAVAERMKDRNGIQMTRRLEGDGAFGREGRHSAPAARLKCSPPLTRRCAKNGNTAQNSTWEFIEHFQTQQREEEEAMNAPV